MITQEDWNKFLKGDLAACKKIHSENYIKLTLILDNRGWCWEKHIESHDIVSLVFEKLLKSRNSGKLPQKVENVEGYLYRITIREAINEFNKSNKYIFSEICPEIEQILAPCEITQKHNLEEIEKAIKVISKPIFKEIIELMRAGFSTDEIAERFRQDKNWVYQNIHRARTALRNSLMEVKYKQA